MRKLLSDSILYSAKCKKGPLYFICVAIIVHYFDKYSEVIHIALIMIHDIYYLFYDSMHTCTTLGLLMFGLSKNVIVI